VIRVGYLQQNAFHQDDTYVPLIKQLKMMDVILYLYEHAKRLISKGIPMRLIMETGIFDKVIKMKYDVSNQAIDQLDDYPAMIDDALASVQ
jgi:V/A-type H+-transporting ATPase subunit A